MKVHNILGNGFQEVFYQRCLSIEPNKNNLTHKREVTISIFYDDREIGSRRADFIVEGEIMVEITLQTLDLILEF